MRIKSLYLLSSFLVVARCLLLAQQTSPVNTETTSEFLWAGVKANREELRTGIFRAHGRHLDDSPDEKVLIEREVDIFCAFDHAEDLLRFDRREPLRRSVPPLEVLERAAGKQVTPQEMVAHGGMYARSRDRSAHFVEGTIGAGVYEREHPPEAQVRAFDVRALGLYYWSELTMGTPFSELYDNYAKETPVEVVPDGEGIRRIRWILEPDVTGLTAEQTKWVAAQRRTLWLDERRGYSPIRLEVVDRVENDPSRVWDNPEIVSDVTWVEVSGVWVPKSYRIEQRHSTGRAQSYELALEWECVNERVPYVLFTVDGFDLAKGTYLVDSRLGKPIITGAVGRSSVPEAGIIRSRAEPKANSRGTFVVVGTTLVLLVVVGCLLYRHFHANVRR